MSNLTEVRWLHHIQFRYQGVLSAREAVDRANKILWAAEETLEADLVGARAHGLSEVAIAAVIRREDLQRSDKVTFAQQSGLAHTVGLT